MSKIMRITLKIIIWIVTVYLVISAIYILIHIDSEKKPQKNNVTINEFLEVEPEEYGPGFSNANNALRVFMGLPITHSSYEGASSLYLISVLIRGILAVALIIIDAKFFRKKLI